MITHHLRRFFEVEIRNEDHGGVRPSTLESALESLEQAPDDVIEDWSGGGSLEDLRNEINTLFVLDGNSLLENYL